MNAPWLPLLDRALDGDTLTDAEHHALAAALRDQDNAGRAGEWLCFEAALRARLSPTSGDALSLARERLLAKAALREKRQQVAPAAPRAARRWPLVAIAAAAVLAIAAGAWLSLRDGYPQPQAEGQFEVVRNGNALGHTSSLRRGDVVRAGVAGARIHLGGYCELEAVQGAQLVIRGEPRREAVKLLAGRLVSRITPGKGQYRVFT
ncbi:hypothetical protein HQ576_07795, partial [bacterium]|nr:hypothetical protein [bacterium]